MHLTTTLLFILIGVSYLPSIVASHYLDAQSEANRDAHSPAHSIAIAQRQHRIRRAVVDTCISVNGTTFLSQAGIVNVALENLQICVCISDLDVWLDTDVYAQLLINVLGRPLVRLVIDAMLIGVGSEECVLSTNAQRICQIDAPCAFECKENYTEEDGECICLPPFQDCNGACSVFSNGCGSASPVVPRRKRRSIPITTLVQAKHACNINESVCGIPGREDTLDFECVDTRDALDSCGACTTPHPFYEAYRITRKGIECGRLPGVVTARCANSRCIVSRCKDGQQPSADKTMCVSTVPNLQQSVIDRFGPRRLSEGQESRS